MYVWVKKWVLIVCVVELLDLWCGFSMRLGSNGVRFCELCVSLNC